MGETNIRRTDAGFRAAQEASADELLEQKKTGLIKDDKSTKKTKKAKESATTTATREDERAAQDIGSAIQKWDNALRGGPRRPLQNGTRTRSSYLRTHRCRSYPCTF